MLYICKVQLKFMNDIFFWLLLKGSTFIHFKEPPLTLQMSATKRVVIDFLKGSDLIFETLLTDIQLSYNNQNVR